MIGAMYLVLIAWLYVALMMAAAEATAADGTLLGAMITFVLYGAAPVALVGYLLDSPRRRRTIKAREAADAHPDDSVREAAAHDEAAVASASPSAVEPDARREAAARAEARVVAPVRKEP